MKKMNFALLILLFSSLKIIAQNPIDSLMHVEGVKQLRVKLMQAKSAKDYLLCIDIVDSLIIMEPNNSEFYYKKGYYHKKNENFDLYLEFINKSMELGYDSVEVYNNLYLSYSIKKDYDKAMFYAEEMIKMKPDSANLYLNIASIYIGKRDFKNYDRYIQIASDKGSISAKESIEYFKKSGTWQKYDD